MKLEPFVKIRDEKFGSAVFDTLREKVYVTNETASDILSLVARGLSKDEVVESLADSYGADPGDIAPDIEAFLADLREKNVISTEGD